MVFSASLAAMWDKAVGGSAEARPQKETAQSARRPWRVVRNRINDPILHYKAIMITTSSTQAGPKLTASRR